jgi:hypothetical protein
VNQLAESHSHLRHGSWSAVVLALSLVWQSAAAADPANASPYPALVTAGGAPLEPSGLVWAADLHLAIAVNDERTEAPGYEIFAFDPLTVCENNTIVAQPLLSRDQSDKLQLDDLEGLTRIGSKEFYAIGSLSLDTPPKKPGEQPEDRWSRHQAVRFTIGRNRDGTLAIRQIARVSKNARPDLREWLISSSGRPWPNESYRKRAERGGINVEGLAATQSGELLIGFRGPLDPEDHAPVLFVKFPGADRAPQARKWSSIDLSGLAGSPEEKKRGIRAIERIPASDGPERFLVVVGPAGGRYDALRLVIWEPRTGSVEDRGQLPDRFVAEGVAVLARLETGMLKVLLVSDLEGRVMVKTIKD